MDEADERLRAVLDGYANFLRERQLALPKHQPYVVRWVREFLHFAWEHDGYTFEQTLDLFLAKIAGRIGVTPWQIQKAADAVRIYPHRCRCAGENGEAGPTREARIAMPLLRRGLNPAVCGVGP